MIQFILVWLFAVIWFHYYIGDNSPELHRILIKCDYVMVSAAGFFGIWVMYFFGIGLWVSIILCIIWAIPSYNAIFR